MENSQDTTITIDTNQTLPIFDTRSLQLKRKILGGVFLTIIAIACVIYFFFSKDSFYVAPLVITNIILSIFFINNEIKFFVAKKINNTGKEIPPGIINGIGLLCFVMIICYFLGMNTYLIFLLLSIIFIAYGIFLRSKYLNTDITALQRNHKIYSFIIYGVIIYMIIILFFLFQFFYSKDELNYHIWYGIVFNSIILVIWTELILSILFLVNVNKLVIAKFRNTGNNPGLPPGIKYGIAIFWSSIVFVGIYLLIDQQFIEPGIFIFVIVTFMIIISMIFIFNGIQKSKMTFVGYGDTIPQKIFRENSGKIGKISLIFPILCILGGFFILFFLMSLGGGLAHGRFLFFGLNRKPRKAIIKDGNSWLIKN